MVGEYQHCDVSHHDSNGYLTAVAYARALLPMVAEPSLCVDKLQLIVRLSAATSCPHSSLCRYSASQGGQTEYEDGGNGSGIGIDWLVFGLVHGYMFQQRGAVGPHA